MIRIEYAVRIYRPVADVFGFAADPTNDPRWSGSSLSVRFVEGTLGLGAIVEQEGKFLGRRMTSRSQIAEFEPGRRIRLASIEDGVRGSDLRIFDVLEPNVTRMSRVVEAEVGSLFRMAEPLVLAPARKQVETDMEMLKTLMDARAESD